MHEILETFLNRNIPFLSLGETESTLLEEVQTY